MAKTQTLKATTRQRTGSGVLKQMRREGQLPSVIYGKGTENVNIKVDTKILTDMLAHSASANIIVDLDVEGSGTQTAFIQSTQKDALTGALLHADFLAVDDSTVINASLPVVLHGEPAGVKNGGLLEQMIHTLDIACSPKSLPESIDADVEALEIGESLTIGGLKLPEGVTTVVAEDVLIAIVNEPRLATEDEDEDEEEGTEEGGDAPAAEAAPAAE
ncbi:50S ribosomal protein L25 [Akkermansiaceae bacterium]|nr:50S ribosomal protein L25 [Akkermansiaceae bacterium]MDA7935854.1 50S ribosomal protein L25 [bacterium]MDB0056473.1 50S ribosomal protein L25 [Akkermansiaceae bacterium]MDB4268352.1 50S ribosomal protein L25 [Akkermansiaceae bacterium]MDB4295902.1 50S ribosomal protein L25 [Akkermansiaceae bacterium]